MMIARFSASVLFAGSLLVSGCKKPEKAPATDPAGSAAPAGSPATAGSAAPTPPTPAAATPPAAGGNTAVVPSATLEALTLPAPKGAPAKGIWSSATAGGDGDRATNFMDGNDLWVSVRFLDCNLPMVKDAATKPAAERGDFAFCFDKPTGMLKDYPLFSPSDSLRVVKVGHLVIIVGLGVVSEGKITAADLEAFIGSLDLAAIAKL